jgi:hypothetical protein
MLDYPLVRANDVCPLCWKPKDPGLVACWSCYHARGMRYGNQEAEELLEQAESRLCEAGEHRVEECKPEPF